MSSHVGSGLCHMPEIEELMRKQWRHESRGMMQQTGHEGWNASTTAAPGVAQHVRLNPKTVSPRVRKSGNPEP